MRAVLFAIALALAACSGDPPRGTADAGAASLEWVRCPTPTTRNGCTFPDGAGALSTTIATDTSCVTTLYTGPPLEPSSLRFGLRRYTLRSIDPCVFERAPDLVTESPVGSMAVNGTTGDILYLTNITGDDRWSYRRVALLRAGQAVRCTADQVDGIGSLLALDPNGRAGYIAILPFVGSGGNLHFWKVTIANDGTCSAGPFPVQGDQFTANQFTAIKAMVVDTHGRIHVANGGDVHVFRPDGSFVVTYPFVSRSPVGVTSDTQSLTACPGGICTLDNLTFASYDELGHLHGVVTIAATPRPPESPPYPSPPLPLLVSGPRGPFFLVNGGVEALPSP